MSGIAASPGRAARWLLLLCTLFGLAAMHTLGHAGMQQDMAAVHSLTTMTSTADLAETATAAFTAAVPCPEDHCDGHHQHGGMDGWSVCVAILTGFAVMVLLTVLVVLLFRRPSAATGAVLLQRRPRPPPTRRAGLSVTSIAVLRI